MPLLRRRPDIRAAEHRYVAAALRVGVAEADLYPRVSRSGPKRFSMQEGERLLLEWIEEEVDAEGEVRTEILIEGAERLSSENPYK